MDQLFANLDFIDRYLGQAQSISMAEQRSVAHDIADAARRLAPVDTGRLRDGIIVLESANTTEIASTAPYSLFQEFGTVNHPAQPFLRPAFHAFSLFGRVGAKHRDNIKAGLV